MAELRAFAPMPAEPLPTILFSWLQLLRAATIT